MSSVRNEKAIDATMPAKPISSVFRNARNLPAHSIAKGITMATTFVSLLLGKKIKSHLAMTGELSLTGQVLPIGGLREKTVAAKRNKIKTIINCIRECHE